MDMGTENKDYLLVQECLSGSEKAWNEFYGRFIGLIRNVVRRHGNLAWEDVQDITQSALLELTSALQKYDAEQPLHSFVCLVTERVLIDEYRKGKAAKRSAKTESVEHHDESHEGTTMVRSTLDSQEEQVEKAELAWSLKNAFQELDAKCRELIRLRYYDDLPFADIAQIAGVTENTVTVQTRRCLDKLRATFRARETRGARG
jgi:RNA polymerase sigma factor (sigma-70 family)